MEEGMFEQYRGIIEHEDNLINHRVSWLLIAQSFLLGACVAKGSYPLIIIIFGFVSTLVSYISIFAAFSALGKIKNKIMSNEELRKHQPEIISTGNISSFGNFGAKYLPLTFLAIWGLLAFYPDLGNKVYSIAFW